MNSLFTVTSSIASKKQLPLQNLKKKKELEEEFYSVLRSACYSNPSFLNEIQKHIELTSHVSSTSTIIGWLKTFKRQRDERLSSYRSEITELLNRYVTLNVDEVLAVQLYLVLECYLKKQRTT